MNRTIVLYNIRVNSRQRFIRLGYHLASMLPLQLPANTNVLINVRGIYKEKSESLFKQYFDQAIFFDKDTNAGWKSDTKEIIEKCNIDYNYVAWMIEDTICLNRDGLQLDNIIASARESDSDFIPLSQHKAKLLFKDKSSIISKTKSLLDYTTETEKINELDFQTHSRMIRSGWETYPIWAFGIYNRKTFDKLLDIEDKDEELMTPFGMEVPPPLKNFPCRISFTKEQFFVTFDDDQGFKGDSLESRGYSVQSVNQTLLRMYENHVDIKRGRPTHRSMIK